jgi:hypothetical protein
MSNFHAAAVLGIVFLMLGACKSSEQPIEARALPRPIEMPGNSGQIILSPSVSNASLPPEKSTSAPESPATMQGKSDPLGSLTKQEESASMPLPRQNNDHSSDVPTTPRK